MKKIPLPAYPNSQFGIYKIVGSPPENPDWFLLEPVPNTYWYYTGHSMVGKHLAAPAQAFVQLDDEHVVLPLYSAPLVINDSDMSVAGAAYLWMYLDQYEEHTGPGRTGFARWGSGVVAKYSPGAMLGRRYIVDSAGVLTYIENGKEYKVARAYGYVNYYQTYLSNPRRQFDVPVGVAYV